MKFSLLLAASAALCLLLAGCSGADGSGTIVKTVDVDNTGDDSATTATDGGGSDITPTDDSGDPIDDFGTTGTDDTGDPGDVIDYPEPGSVEYWKAIIPGTWEQTNPDTGEAYCATPESPGTCSPLLEIYDFSSGDDAPEESGCPAGTKYLILGELGATGGLCINPDNTLSACAEGLCESWGFHILAAGKLSEKVIIEGTCSQKADGMPSTCVRHADCAGVVPDAFCNNMKVEQWIEFCQWTSGDNSCDDGTTYHYMKTQ